ncbi:MAG: glycine cleavage system protein GcvH [Clostridia bacterium]|nr:glycine cleavage system protein GcvH [Clostridia bacterium]
MNTPKDLFYTAEHEWLRFTDDTTAQVGITDFAQNALGDIVYVNLPAEGDAVAAGASFAEIESVKAVSEVFCPVTGLVAAVNEALLDAPETLNADPYGAWLAEIRDISDRSELLDAAAYEALCQKEA